MLGQNDAKEWTLYGMFGTAISALFVWVKTQVSRENGELRDRVTALEEENKTLRTALQKKDDENNLLRLENLKLKLTSGSDASDAGSSSQD